MNLFRITIILSLFAVQSTNASAQVRYEDERIYPLEKYVYDSTYRIVGMPRPYGNKYKKYAFIVSNVSHMKALANSIMLFQKSNRVFEMDHFVIYIIKSNVIIDEFIVNPVSSNIPINGQFYFFDFDNIKDLSLLYRLNFTAKEITFKSRKEYESYVQDVKRNPNFLFIPHPNTQSEGSFEIVVPKSNSIGVPKEAIDSLYKEFYEQKLGPINIVYVLSDENRKNPSQFVLKVHTSRSVYDLYKPNVVFRKRGYLAEKIKATFIFKR